MDGNTILYVPVEVEESDEEFIQQEFPALVKIAPSLFLFVITWCGFTFSRTQFFRDTRIVLCNDATYNFVVSLMNKHVASGASSKDLSRSEACWELMYHLVWMAPAAMHKALRECADMKHHASRAFYVFLKVVVGAIDVPTSNHEMDVIRTTMHNNKNESFFHLNHVHMYSAVMKFPYATHQVLSQEVARLKHKGKNRPASYAWCKFPSKGVPLTNPSGL